MVRSIVCATSYTSWWTLILYSVLTIYDVHNCGAGRDKKITDIRTSSTVWCSKEECMTNSTHILVRDRIEEILSIPHRNFEPFQFLQYEEGQYYKLHHDYGGHQKNTMEGVRSLTVFLYLNDVEAGGGTNFKGSAIDLTVMPKAGKALIWPSVIDLDPDVKDGRTRHQALPVEKGIKYSVNVWVHGGNFQEALWRNCIKP